MLLSLFVTLCHVKNISAIVSVSFAKWQLAKHTEPMQDVSYNDAFEQAVKADYLEEKMWM